MPDAASRPPPPSPTGSTIMSEPEGIGEPGDRWRILAIVAIAVVCLVGAVTYIAIAASRDPSGENVRSSAIES